MASMPHLNRLIDLALEEDIGTGDITTETLIPAVAEGRAEIVAKEPLVLAGLAVAQAVFRRLDPTLNFEAACADGDRLRLISADCAAACLSAVVGRAGVSAWLPSDDEGHPPRGRTADTTPARDAAGPAWPAHPASRPSPVNHLNS